MHRTANRLMFVALAATLASPAYAQGTTPANTTATASQSQPTLSADTSLNTTTSTTANGAIDDRDHDRGFNPGWLGLLGLLGLLGMRRREVETTRTTYTTDRPGSTAGRV